MSFLVVPLFFAVSRRRATCSLCGNAPLRVPKPAARLLSLSPGPFVVHLKHAIVELAKEYQPKGVKVLAISSNSAETHPQDGPERMAEDAVASGYCFPYLYDATQEVAKAYQAACTPEFLVGAAGSLVCDALPAALVAQLWLCRGCRPQMKCVRRRFCRCSTRI